MATAIRTIAGIEAELKALLGAARLAELHASLNRIAGTAAPVKDHRRSKAKGK